MLQVNFIMMIQIIPKISVLLKTNRITFKRVEGVSGSIIDFYFFKKINQFFSQYIMMKCSGPEKDKTTKENIINDVRNLFRLKK